MTEIENWTSLLRIDNENEKLDLVEKILQLQEKNLEAAELELKKLKIKANVINTQQVYHNQEMKNLNNEYAEFQKDLDKNGALTEEEKLMIDNEYQKQIKTKLAQLYECVKESNEFENRIQALEKTFGPK
ncbi:hypothetical protein TVAG_441060 [Trichomonas vaginalis G3]|uniref:Uncharacterized protein n=1 Tax=Trichomonas vaginalis (strain ATCC PRA-98 / G3) TaxID=412133 RepID=A2FSS1_TRIV3|nr:hypothetical protein TVAGG3_0927990 [Trichomonas vaginalis G3]EAX92043.1 hypothetical protein TVAG_441060 [Trichomonas vaginalis G3]KAI5485622.1 hypothetical protein TVAGG3_0927990 [Trichomonas vaginalis G3]|eukprot:XP_001304973.1 hypothetical protein [Trichomonas vaginalis G3]